jgi:secretion/DNA translocation related TadE-like protein
VTLCLVGILVFLALVVAGAVALVDAHRRAQAAADLAALAGAGALQAGRDSCVAAADVAGRNHARLTGCVIDGDDVVVEVAVPAPRVLGSVPDLPARARAGPVGGNGGLAPSVP